jgi:hypothetical protein
VEENHHGIADGGVTVIRREKVDERRKAMKMTIVNFDRITVDPEQMNGQPCIRII